VKDINDLFIFGCTKDRSLKIFTEAKFKAFGDFNGSWIEDLTSGAITEFKEPLMALKKVLELQNQSKATLAVALSYEFGELLESVRTPSKADYKFPLYVIYGYSNEIDDRKRKTFIESIYQVQEKEVGFSSNSIDILGQFSSWKKADYIKVVEQIRELIATGEVYQVNLSQDFKMPFATGESIENSWQFFSHLAKNHPAPYSCYFNIYSAKAGNIGTVVSNSPELFFKKIGNVIKTCPIKGTAPRGKDVRSDNANREFLENSAKDIAELSMIVDLKRNDLGRISKVGSIRVNEHATLKEYSNVFHLVSEIQGEILVDISIVNIFEALFPGGSITGTPKIAARKFIADLEPVRRNVYTGAIGLIDPSGDCHFSVAIRTGVITNNILYFNAGGGVTYDSQPADEYEETLAKASAFFDVFSKITCREKY
jgi:anthranilate/para-aminobenzoate synthase component I